MISKRANANSFSVRSPGARPSTTLKLLILRDAGSSLDALGITNDDRATAASKLSRTEVARADTAFNRPSKLCMFMLFKGPRKKGTFERASPGSTAMRSVEAEESSRKACKRVLKSRRRNDRLLHTEIYF